MPVNLSNVKYVLSDIDGTILNIKDEYVKELLYAVILAKDRGISIGLCTNRALSDTLPLYNILTLNGPIIFEDGAAIYLPQKNKEINLIQELTDINAARESVINAINSDELNKVVAPERVLFKLNQNKKYCISVHIKRENGERCDTLVKRIVPVIEDLLADFNDLLTYDTGKGNFIIRYTNSGKDKAISYLCENKLIEPQETLIIGDGDNDICAFKAIQIKGGLACAVQNATNSVKTFVDFISEYEYSYGVADILNRIVGKKI